MADTTKETKQFEEYLQKELWWGYLHTEGTIQVKRYFSQEDLKEADESSFVRMVIGPFKASNRQEAIETIQKILLTRGFERSLGKLE